MRNIFFSRDDNSWLFWLMAVFVIFAILIGGGSRSDNTALIFLRPASIIICCIAIWLLKREYIVHFKVLFIFAVLFFAVVCVQLLPLPPAIWTALPGRDLVTQIDRTAGIFPVWRPISMVPVMTWNAFYSLFVPLAALLVGVQLTPNERQRLLTVITLCGLLSGFIGLLQVVGDLTGPLYFYRITNNGSAVGLFANRNHQAVFLSCLFPLLAVFASIKIRSQQQHRARLMIAIGAGIVLVPLLLVTGSRMGIVTGLIGLLSVIFLYEHPSNLPAAKRRGGRLNINYFIGGLAIIILSLLSVVFSRAQALQRLTASDDAQDLRFQIWGPVIEQGWQYFPVGAGAGGFAQVYQVGERQELLFPDYLNLPHNDFIEIYFSFGLVGIALIVFAVIGWMVASYRIWRSPQRNRSSVRFGKVASIVMVIFTVGSITDYPLRNPSMMVLWTVCCLWLVDALKLNASKVGDNPG